MAVRYIGSTSTAPQVQGNTVVGADSGGTLAGSQKVQVVFDDAVFTSAQEGKERLLSALKIIFDRISTAKTWPIDSTS
jgi:hypothetical protein